MNKNYVLITAARNEDAFIDLTIQSVIDQTILPKKWLIVSDGSTDRTDDIVQSYAKTVDWIEHLQMPARSNRHFAGKAYAFNTGFDSLKSLKYDIIGNIDADISFESDYFEYLLKKMEIQPKLGVCGTHYTEGKFHSYNDSYINIHHVNGQVQLFRRKCLEEIGGYVPSRYGGIDWIAVTTARMKGWGTFSFEGKVYEHHRKMGTANSNVLRSRFQYGKKDYFLGGHPIWETFRVIFQFSKFPFFIGGLCIFAGYFWASMVRMEKPISEELVQFIRKEQIQRLNELFRKIIKIRRLHS